MKRNRIRILAWILAGVAITGSLIQIALWATRRSGPPTMFDWVEAFGWGLALPVVFSVLAALIIARQPRNRVGWMMMIIALALNNPVDLTVGQLQGPPATVTLGLWLLLWVSGWSWIPVIFPIFLIPLYFPTGNLPSTRWKWVPILAIGLSILFLLLTFFLSQGGPGNADWAVPNPVGFIPVELVSGPFLILWGIGLLTVFSASVYSLFRRYRDTVVAERQQIRWLLVAGGVFLVFYAITLFSPGPWLENGLQNLVFVLAVLMIPGAIAVAIFRYRLWDLDVFINRAVIYGLLTTLLAGLFAAVIAIVTEVGKELLGEGSRAAGAAVSALVVAVVFQPLRSWIEGWVNRRFYPEKLDLASGLVEVQPEFWGFLDQPTLVQVSLDHVSRTLGTPYAAFFLRSGQEKFRLAGQIAGSVGKSRSVKLSPKELAELVRKRVVAAADAGSLAGHVPVYVDRGKTNDLLGLLSIGSRPNGRGYSGDDLKALAELGGKIGLALKAVQLGEGASPG